MNLPQEERTALFNLTTEESKHHFLALMRLCRLKHNIMNNRVGYWHTTEGFAVYDSSNDLWLMKLLTAQGFTGIEVDRYPKPK